MSRLDLTTIRKRLAGANGRVYWRSLEELADTDEFREVLYREFPQGASEFDVSLDRRSFLKLMGASLALAGITGGCYRQPEEKIYPYIEQPENLVPGKPLFFASAMPFGGYGMPVLVESHMGRPTKVEGNPEHPGSLGATTPFMQASVLNLYDPDRSQAVARGGQLSSWVAFVNALQPVLSRLRDRGGAGLRLLTGTITSPTLIWQIQRLRESYPELRWHRFEPVGRDNSTAGAKLAFGRAVDSIYEFERADVIVSLESNFLYDDSGSIRYARDFIQRRRVPRLAVGPITPKSLNPSRLFVAESSPTITGAMSGRKLPIRSSRIVLLAQAIAATLGGARALPDLDPSERAWLEDVVGALEQHRGTSLIVAGEYQPPVVHALVHAINAAMGNVGTTLRYVEPVAPPPAPEESLQQLVADVNAGKVEMLVAIDCNPAYAAPADLNFAEAVQKVPLRVHQGMYFDETAFVSNWHVPMSHYLESWSDIRAYNGLPTIVQPLIQPLYSTHTPHELLGLLRGEPAVPAYDTVREYWRTRLPPNRFEQAWREALHLGFVAGQESPPAQVQPNMGAIAGELRSPTTSPSTAPATTAPAADGSIELVFRPDPNVWDGTFATNAWMQELPKPLSKLTWDNAAFVSPAMAQRLGMNNNDVVALRFGGRELGQVPVWILPGHADGAVTIPLGYGRRLDHRIAGGTGFDAYRLRQTSTPWFGTGLEIRKTGRSYPLATTQQHFVMEGRDLVRRTTAEGVFSRPTTAPGAGDGHDVADEKVQTPGEVMPDAAEHAPKAGASRRLPLSLYPDQHPSDPPYRSDSRVPNYAWAMSIDLSSCIGCNACVVACQSENNIPVVGRDGVLVSREMHWLRIDTYYSAGPEDVVPDAGPGSGVRGMENPPVYFQPLPCMHCEKAPCEVVCPVAATTHSSEGINEMTYNRCVGTRYCSNNCPYKVRRFNFLEYARGLAEPVLRMAANPDVTVRTRGVMEKCTYCIQRIKDGRINAELQDRRIYDGEVVTACAQACPTQAIVFGDMTDRRSAVHMMKFKPPFDALDYGLLNEHLGTRPRTTYLPRLVLEGPPPDPSEAGPTGGGH